MHMLKRINKGVGAAATAIVLVGGTPVVVQAMPNNTDIPKLEAKTICRNMEKSIKNGKYKVNNLNEKFYSNMNISSQNQKESNKKEEVNIKVLQEKSDATSMAGGYIKKVEHEIVNGKQYLILSIDSIDWMSNITAAIDGSEEIKVDEIERSAKKVADGKGKQVGKIKFEIKDLSSKILMHMNVEPMGNNRVAFRIISVNVNDDEHNKNKTSNEEIKKDENKVKDNKKETNKKENLEKGDSKEKQDLNKKSIEDGIYTIGFEAYHLENPEASSMLGNFFDKNVKLEVKNGKKKITMLNTCFADGVLDYRIGSNNIFKESIGMWYGNVNEDGKYPYKTYEMEISELEDDYIACVLAGPMGGVKKDIGDFSKYKQAKIVFNKEYKKGWSGFERDKKVIDYNKNLTKALIEAGVDKDGNGIITEGEIASIKDELDISVKGIKDISLLKNLGSSIKRLYLIGNHIDKLPEGIFDNLTNLEVLYLNGNRIKELPKRIFDKLTNLKELQLNQNMIEEIPSGIFDKLVNLKSLVISDNPLKEADFSTLNKLNKLEYLSIENCNLREMPKEIFKLCKLKTLNASKNDITIIPKEISALKELKEMNFSINYIEEIPEEVYTKLPNLEKLQINDNLVKYIPLDVFYKAPKLRSLDFIMNKLDKIPQIPEEFKGKKSIWAYPQKTYMDIKLSAENGKISWKQNLSGMDMIVWKMIHPSGKTATTLDEFKKDFENKEILELMHSNSCEPTVKTVIQKKDSNGDYITLKEIISEDKIDLPEVAEDKNMKKGDQYRIIKTVSARSYSMDVYVLRDVAYAKAISECSSTGAKHNVVKEEKTKNINMKILKEKSNEPSMAAQYVDKSVKYIEKAGKKYFTVTLNRMDWMKNVQIEAGGKEVVATKNENGNIGEFTFEVENENSEVTMRMNVVPMNNARVAFRLVNTNVAGKDNKQDKEKLQGNNKDEQEVRIKTLPNVKSSRYGEIYGRLEYEIMVEDSKYINIVDYTRSISEVTVNGVKYQRDFSLGINKYYFGLSGALELNEDEFTKEVNKIVLKSNKYNTMIINVKKDGTLVDSKEVKSEKNKINTPPMLEVGKPLKIELGNKVDLMEGVSAIDEEDGEITKNIKIDCGKLNVDNPIKGIYNVTYSITDTKGETVTKIREIQITGKEVSVDNLEDGIYTLNFTARRIDDETRSSMLEDFFDRNIKVTVKNGKIVLNMLNIMHANTLYDLRIESNNKFNKTTSKYYGQPNPKDGSYKMQIFEVPMDSLKGSHVGGVLVGMMGGYKTQIGNMDNYTKVKFIFSDKCTKGWDGFITKEDKLNYDENLSKALLKLELDKNKDGNVSNEEIALAEGVISLNQKELKDISKLKYMGNKVTSLQLNGNYIETLPQGIFDNLTELKELTINSNLLQSLDEHIFDKLTKLEYLTMDSNKLRRLPENIFSKLVNLKTIGFTGNQLQELPDNLFHNNNKLEELYLGNNKLKALPKSLSTLPNLKSLYLEDNELTLVPIEFKKFKNLEKLNISNNKITNIPEEVYKKLNKLKELDLSDNKLTHIPSDIENIMPNLKRLNIKLNNVVDIPKTNISNYEYSPQKNVLNLKLQAKDGKLRWNQELSSLDVLCWTRVMNGINEESPKNIDEYKKSLNGKTARELLTGKVDWKIETELQKKNSEGQYITLSTTAEEVKDDILSGQFNDPNMHKDDEYRIIKTVKSIGAAEEIVFSEIAYTSIKPVEKPIIQEKNKDKEKEQGKDKDKEKSIINIEKPAVYEAKVIVDKTNKENEKVIKKYLNVDEKINIEVKDKQAYMTLKLKGQQKDIKAIKVDGKEIKEFEVIGEDVVKVNRLVALNEVAKTKVEESKGSTTIRFKIPNEKAKVEITMHNEAENKDETFAIKLKEDTVKEVKDNSSVVEKPNNTSTTSTSHRHSRKNKKHKEDKNDDRAKPSEETKNDKEDKNDDAIPSEDTNVKEDKNNDVNPNTDAKDNNKKDDSFKESKENKQDKEKDNNSKNQDGGESKDNTTNKKQDNQEQSKVTNKEKSSSVKNTESAAIKKDTKIKEKKLPQTGMPFGSGLLATIGGVLSGLGVILGKRNKKNKK